MLPLEFMSLLLLSNPGQRQQGKGEEGKEEEKKGRGGVAILSLLGSGLGKCIYKLKLSTLCKF